MRLAPDLDDTQREAVAWWLAKNTLSVLDQFLPSFALCDDPETYSLLLGHNFNSILCGDRGLNASVKFGISWAEEKSFDAVGIVHSDLPLIGDIAGDSVNYHMELLNSFDLMIAPDRSTRGTNAVFISLPTSFIPYFGPDSFVKHTSCASRAGASLYTWASNELTTDLDTPKDLVHILTTYPESKFAQFVSKIFPGKTHEHISIANA